MRVDKEEELVVVTGSPRRRTPSLTRISTSLFFGWLDKKFFALKKKMEREEPNYRSRVVITRTWTKCSYCDAMTGYVCKKCRTPMCIEYFDRIVLKWKYHACVCETRSVIIWVCKFSGWGIDVADYVCEGAETLKPL